MNTWGGKRIGAGRPADLDPAGQKNQNTVYIALLMNWEWLENF